VGVFEEAKGKVKEAAGDLAGNEELKDEGQAQQDKGAEERQADEHAAKAKAHEKKADLAESRMD